MRVREYYGYALIAGIPVEIKRKSGQKNLYIRVSPPEGTVTVSAPIEASDEDIMAIAKDIWNHSSCEEFGGTFADFLWGIYNKCLRYEIVED